MKKINTRGFANVAVVVIGLLLVGLGSYAMIQNRAHAPTATSAVNTSDWKTYKNEKYGFEFKYPNTWILNESDFSNFKGFTVKAVDPKYPGKPDTDVPLSGFVVMADYNDGSCYQSKSADNDWLIGEFAGTPYKTICSENHKNITVTMIAVAPSSRTIEEQILSTFKFTK